MTFYAPARFCIRPDSGRLGRCRRTAARNINTSCPPCGTSPSDTEPERWPRDEPGRPKGNGDKWLRLVNEWLAPGAT